MNDGAKKILAEFKRTFVGHRENVIETIQKTVNGKIDNLVKSQQDWHALECEKRLELETKLDDYIESTKPMVEFFEDMTSSKRVLFWLLGGLASIGGGWLMIREIFK